MCRTVLSHHDGDLVSEGDPGVVLCGGRRHHGVRKFALPELPLLSFHVHAFYTNGRLRSLAGIPPAIIVDSVRLCLVGATFFQQGHYNAGVLQPGLGWLQYDGVVAAEKRLSFAGDVSRVHSPGINHVIFVNEDLL